VETFGLLERWPVTGRVEDDQLLLRRVDQPEPFLGGPGPAWGLVSSLHEVDGDLELDCIGAEVDVLELRVQDGEDVEERGEVMQLLHQGVLLDEDVLRETTGPSELEL
jgi:hypothetical protein